MLSKLLVTLVRRRAKSYYEGIELSVSEYFDRRGLCLLRCGKWLLLLMFMLGDKCGVKISSRCK